MNTAFSSFLLVLLAALCVQCQEEEGCGVLKIKCRKNQYCFRPKLNLDLDLGVCLPYLRKGALCNDDLRCSPELECKEVKSIIRFKTCQEPSSKPTDDGNFYCARFYIQSTRGIYIYLRDFRHARA
ncbi:unnamed protein product [Larinioides sclopetarius]|uniref:Uncharacterized protein n=1 Tax=Larinioides sclopetarius TaxID=280406 RepID=A0AAV1ZBS7_9ARAC